MSEEDTHFDDHETSYEEKYSKMTNVDHFFLTVLGIIVFFMQCGFGFLEAGAVRSKNTGKYFLAFLERSTKIISLDPVFGQPQRLLKVREKRAYLKQQGFFIINTVFQHS